MDLPQLRAFLEVAREGNLTRAANALFLSQPALSSRIKALEDELGLKLFERSAKGMSLTRYGEILAEEAARTVHAARAFMSRAKTINSSMHGQIRLGTIIEPVALRLGEFLSGMLVACPNVTISISQGISGVVIDRILSGELDAGYVIGKTDEAGLISTQLGAVRFLIAGPPDWRDRLNAAGWSDLGDYPWVGTPPKCSYNRIMQDLFARKDLRPRRIAEADEENMLRSLVARGLGLSILREDQALAAASAGEVCIWPHGDTHSVLCFIQRADEAHAAVHTSMIEVVRSVWKISYDGDGPAR